MKRNPTLERRIARWFAASLLMLYGVVAIGLWATYRTSQRQVAMLTLETEAEAVATYIAATGRLDAPELEAAELEPFPIWLRVFDESEKIAATPGAPAVPWAPPGTTEQILYLRTPGAAEPFLVVRHEIGGRAGRAARKHRATAIEAIGDIHSLRVLERRLVAGLVVLGLIIIPIAAWGGRLLARRALAPIADLVGEIRALTPDRLDKRLHLPARAVDEVQVLATSFNDVLERLETSIATMRRFTADASHEIRNPLSVMRTGLEVALRRDRPTAEYRTLLAENLEEIDQLQATLEGLLALARAEPGRPVEIARDRVDFGALVRRVAERFAASVAERGVELRLELPTALEVVGDERLLRLIPFNLIDNALKHGPRGGTVSVEASRNGEASATVRLQVRDDGAGIPAEARPRIFDRYRRLDPDAGEGGVGGLGLSVVRWVAEAHGGQASLVEAEPGACFEVQLPAA